MRKKHSKKSLIAGTKTRIGNSAKSAQKALLTIYAQQTRIEKSHGATLENNSAGFTGMDAGFLSSLARQLLERGFLSRKQNEYLQRIMPKYAAQIQRIKQDRREAREERRLERLYA